MVDIHHSHIDWRFNLATPDGSNPSDLLGGHKMLELPMGGAAVDHVFTVPFGGFFFVFWFSEPGIPGVGDPDLWKLPVAHPFLDYEIIVPNAEITLIATCYRVNTIGQIIQVVGGSMPTAPQTLNLTGVYHLSGAAGVQQTNVSDTDRIELFFFFARNTNKGSLDVTMRLNNNPGTFLEIPVKRNRPRSAAGAALVSRRGAPVQGPSLFEEYVILNFTSSTASPPAETFLGYENIDGAVPIAYPDTGHGVFGDVTLGFVSGIDGHRDRDNPLAPDERHDSYVNSAIATRRDFQIDVPNGVYQVRAVAGDADIGILGLALRVNGILYWFNENTAPNIYLDVTKTHVVTTGSITVNIGAGSGISILNFLVVTRQRIAGAEPVVVSRRVGDPTEIGKAASAVAISSERGGPE